jgi:hypothetical protein
MQPQVHEKTNKRGTWAFHSVDGWYLFTSPEHYCTHNCHVKHTKIKGLSDTVQFQHKRITNPSITHANKVMHALDDCITAIQGMTGKDRHSPATMDLQRIVDATQAQIKAQPDQFEHTATDTPPVQQVPRVQTTVSMPIPHTDANRRITRLMNMTTPFPRVPINSVPTNKPTAPPPTNKPTAPPTDSMRRECIQKRRAAWLRSTEPMINTSPCIQTQAQVATAAAWVAPPALSKCLHTRQSNLLPPSRWPGFAAAVMQQQQHQRGMVQLTQCITQLENKVHQALAVMDANTGKLLNYRQLMRSMKYNKVWSFSSAYEFGWLANGISGRIKNPTNTIEFIYQHKVPKEQKQDVTYGQFVCTVQPKKAEPNQTWFTVGGDRINYSGKVPIPTTEMLVAKMLFNSVISTKGARFMTMDISNFYLMTP